MFVTALILTSHFKLEACTSRLAVKINCSEIQALFWVPNIWIEAVHIWWLTPKVTQRLPAASHWSEERRPSCLLASQREAAGSEINSPVRFLFWVLKVTQTSHFAPPGFQFSKTTFYILIWLINGQIPSTHHFIWVTIMNDTNLQANDSYFLIFLIIILYKIYYKYHYYYIITY